VLSDALDSCQKLIGQQYLEYHARAIREATCWQDAEAALFALRYCTSCNRSGNFNEGPPPPLPNPTFPWGRWPQYRVEGH